MAPDEPDGPIEPDGPAGPAGPVGHERVRVEGGAREVAEQGPPPPPVDAAPRAVAPQAPRSGRARRGRALRIGLLIVLAAGGGFLAGLAASDLVTVPDVLRGRAALEAEHGVELVGLLEDIIRTEAVMLAFNDELEERLEGAADEASALRSIAAAASEGVEGLEALRPSIVERTGGDRVAEVRTVYLPHLDSWIDYLAALAERPEMLLRGTEQQPYILRINATADAFRIALEGLIASGPAGEVAELAERILDDGFRSEGPAPTL